LIPKKIFVNKEDGLMAKNEGKFIKRDNLNENCNKFKGE
jgi:hypothetical protein